jgi:hypothetical protein
MGAVLFTMEPYIEMTISSLTIVTPAVGDWVVTWRVPLGRGSMVYVSLNDCEYYVRWLFDHPERASCMDLEVAIAHILYAELATAFEKVTGYLARYINTSLKDYWQIMFRGRTSDVRLPARYNADPKDKRILSFKDNFTGF